MELNVPGYFKIFPLIYAIHVQKSFFLQDSSEPMKLMQLSLCYISDHKISTGSMIADIHVYEKDSKIKQLIVCLNNIA